MPKRIQRKRTKGWKMPEGAVYVGRPTKWGNPFEGARDYPSRELAVARFRAGLDGCAHPDSFMGTILSDVKDLRGKDLACWCPLDQPCHADVLLELANRED
ncbi:DUF4326 domain-containing protein [Pseudohoeflea coraliihabitans]|uniref:DUF4326 domain-containing protein n=1 Tax=Pseudohoeflea coraliihabitans TaxID=2860393 RepID=A0ABS6WP29_9HYPH|nr:DUF4326 domain-containing protein [Pseudohoeflea sp. DP4N28-3]MBW3096855.1 DUF4326 domain-containing protein [Pseudohoeflea sp. DP4N28-3]